MSNKQKFLVANSGHRIASSVQGREVVVTVPNSQSCTWNFDTPNPPLSSEEAVEIAILNCNKILPPRAGLEWAIIHIELRCCNHQLGHWIWVTSLVEWLREGANDGRPTPIRLAVLMDGTFAVSYTHLTLPTILLV